MSKGNLTGGPQEGELVVVTVKTVKQNGCYVDLDEFKDIEGFIFIGEIASGWVKNIRGFVREGQRLICKVMRTRKDGTSLELSLKSVSEERRRGRLQEWKNEKRAHQLLKVIGERVSWTEDEIAETAEELSGSFETLYGSFEEAAMKEGALVDAGFEGEWIKVFIEVAIENIIPDFVEVRGTISLSIDSVNGIEVIRESLLAAENFSSEADELEISCHYNGAPQYRIELKAPDFKSAESAWENATNAAIEFMQSSGGEARAWRE